MSEIHNVDNMVAKIANEHKIVIDYVAKFNKKHKEKDEQFFNELPSFFSFLEKDMLKHFMYEEVVIFPAAILCNNQCGNALLVLTLQKDHGMIEDQLTLLKTEVDSLESSKAKPSDELIDKIRVFFDLLKTHCRREMTDLYPMLDSNSKFKALLGIYTKELNK